MGNFDKIQIFAIGPSGIIGPPVTVNSVAY